MSSGFPQVTVRKLKFDGSLKYEWPGDLVEPPSADWVIVYHHPLRHPKRQLRGVPVQRDPAHMLHYIALTQPLTLIFAFSPSGDLLDAKCDAALPGTLDGATADFVDLDLDVVVLPGGQHYVRDQEVFAERSLTMNYSAEAKRAAHLGILHALRLVRRRQFPFDGHAEALIARLLSGTRAAK